MTNPRYLLDSNIIIYALVDPNGIVVGRIEQYFPGELATSSIAYGEVLRGIPPVEVDARTSTEGFFDQLVVLPFDQRAARVYAELPFKRGGFDRLIAAHALASDLILVTNNERDFSGIARLAIENWAR